MGTGADFRAGTQNFSLIYKVCSVLLLEKLNFKWFNRLPMIRQSQAAECGLACLGMIANYHGHQIDMITLRRQFATSLKGATLADVIAMAQQLNIDRKSVV